MFLKQHTGCLTDPGGTETSVFEGTAYVNGVMIRIERRSTVNVVHENSR